MLAFLLFVKQILNSKQTVLLEKLTVTQLVKKIIRLLWNPKAKAKLSLRLTKYHAMKTYGGVEV
jgi:hypothetical protein